MRKEEAATPGMKLRHYRELLGYSQPYLAKRLGVTTQFISNVERNTSPIPFALVPLLSKIFCCSISEIALYALESTKAHKEFLKLLDEDVRSQREGQ